VSLADRYADRRWLRWLSLASGWRSVPLELTRFPDTQVARELGLNRETLRQWVKQVRIDQGELEGLTSSEREEAELRMERELLNPPA
jgi:Transposase